MQTPTPASQATRARKPKAPAIPALMPLPSIETKPISIFWAVHALNCDAQLQAIEAIEVRLRGTHTSYRHTERMAMITANSHAEMRCQQAFKDCIESGGLPFVWRGSRALVQALPASLRGAA